MRRGPPAEPTFDRSILRSDPVVAARAILGARLVREDPDGGLRVGRIVEVEAYGSAEDAASHARHGRTPRNAAMFGPPGHAYVYRIYGLHDCLNVVSGADGDAAAVLLRAVEPITGLERMRAARGMHPARRNPGTTIHDADGRLASGPGRLGAAFSVSRADDGIDLCDPGSALRLMAAPASESGHGAIVATPRIGVPFAGDPWSSMAWRFLDAGSPSVSGTRRSAGGT